jgi:hypothetical protein
VGLSGTLSAQSVADPTVFAFMVRPFVTLTPIAGGTSITLATDADGSFAFSSVQPGSYKVNASARGFLAAERTGIIISDTDVILLPVVLRAGLVNDDNTVSILDISAAAASFGSVVTGRADELGRIVDVNADGVVSILDISAIASNFGSVSPVAWPP